MLIARPKVAELTFQLYGRPLHPELFAVHKVQQVEREDYQAKIEITGAGHVVTWNSGSGTLAEVATSKSNPLPRKRRLMFHRLRGERSERLECRGGVIYQTRFELELVDPAVFWMVQEELLQDDQCAGMQHTFHSNGRLSLGAVSYVNVETRSRAMRIQAFHTFPDDCAIVKSESQFLLPK